MAHNHTLICTVCSRRKSSEEKLLPARERYLGSHIAYVERIARSQGFPFYVLSGVYGLIDAQHPIPAYDHLLSAKEAESEKLIATVGNQVQESQVERICFYMKQEPLWTPYRTLIGIAALRQRVDFAVIQLPLHV